MIDMPIDCKTDSRVRSSPLTRIMYHVCLRRALYKEKDFESDIIKIDSTHMRICSPYCNGIRVEAFG